MSSSTAEPRVAWVDAAKGLCILLVVLMHATLGVEKATGATTALNGFIEWARPFRMPDFFLISGLFLAARISRPWPKYLDTKVVYFAYFYVLWLTIQFSLKAPGMIAANGFQPTLVSYLAGFVQPWGTLWFIYMLAVFFVAAKLLDCAPKALVWAVAAIVHLAAPHTGWLLIDEFANRFVFFYTGYWAAPVVFAFAAWTRQRAVAAVAGALVLWAAANWLLVQNGLAFVQGPDLIISFAGVAAVVAFSVIMGTTLIGRGFSALGRNSIIIYLAFPLFMGPARILALKVGAAMPTRSVALISTAAGVADALLLAHFLRDTRFSFLFERPQFARMGGTRPRLVPAARLSWALASRPET
jgi:uncharacterized membrane protein YcfT